MGSFYLFLGRVSIALIALSIFSRKVILFLNEIFEILITLVGLGVFIFLFGWGIYNRLHAFLKYADEHPTESIATLIGSATAVIICTLVVSCWESLVKKAKKK